MDRKPDCGYGLDQSCEIPVFISLGLVQSQSFSSLDTGPANTTHLQVPIISSSKEKTAFPGPAHDNNFDPLTINIWDPSLLKPLKRQDLNKLCYFYKLPAGATNEAVIAHLLKVPL